MTDERRPEPAGPPPEPARLLALVAVGSGLLFVGAVVLVVVVQLVAPLFGLAAGSPSDAVLGSMLVWAGIAFGILPAAAWLKRRSGG